VKKPAFRLATTTVCRPDLPPKTHRNLPLLQGHRRRPNRAKNEHQYPRYTTKNLTKDPYFISPTLSDNHISNATRPTETQLSDALAVESHDAHEQTPVSIDHGP
jgi:hypothetical protein